MTKKTVMVVVITLLGVSRGGQWERSITGSFSAQRGNTDLTSYVTAFSAEYVGDVTLGSLSLKDSEVKLAFGHKRGTVNRALYEDDGNASFLIDIMAHQIFSPFFLSYWAYDSTTSLEKRIQLGAGAKYILGHGFSASLACVWEVEDYRHEPQNKQFRWSLRPKYKKTFANGMAVNFMIFYQPLVKDFSDFLIDHQLTLSVPTLIEKLKLTLSWQDKYVSHPPKEVKNRDSDVYAGLTISF